MFAVDDDYVKFGKQYDFNRLVCRTPHKILTGK